MGTGKVALQGHWFNVTGLLCLIIAVVTKVVSRDHTTIKWVINEIVFSVGLNNMIFPSLNNDVLGMCLAALFSIVFKVLTLYFIM